MPNEFDMVQALMQAKKYKEASLLVTKYLTHTELGNASAISKE